MNIVITGGSSGLGKALVELCAATADNYVVFTYCRHKDNALALTEQFNNVEAIAVDFSLTDQVESLAERLADMQVDILVNNAYAGHAQGVHFHKTAPEDFANAFNQNVIPMIKITQACIKGMRKRKFGKIINIITAYVIDVPPTGFSVYTATKAYIRQLSKSISKEYGRFNITVNCVLPDYMQTPFGQVEDFQLEQMRNAHPLKTLLKPEEVAQIVVQLMSASQQLNGVEIPINAAQHLL